MHIEILVEERSAASALKILVPKIVGETVSFEIYEHDGKPDLLAKLPARLRSYRNWLPGDSFIVVLHDRDAKDCQLQKLELEQICANAGLITKTAVTTGGKYSVVNRLAIEELEAWFFGDVEAIVAAYPRVDSNLSSKAAYRDPDAIKGGTWEALEKVLQNAGYYSNGIAKLIVAQDIATHMDPIRNRSHSFQVFRAGLLAIVAQAQTS